MSEISDTLLKQRLRNRIIEALEMFSDHASVEEIGTNEIINSWYDNMDDDWDEFYNEPIFTKNEINALKRFHNLLESLYISIPTTWNIQDLIKNESWLKLETTAKEELQIFMERGLLDEEVEIT